PLSDPRARRTPHRHAERGAHAGRPRDLRFRPERRRAGGDHGAARGGLTLQPLSFALETVPIDGKGLMSTTGASAIGKIVEDIYRRDSRRVLATLIRVLGDFDLAEEA